MVDDPDCGRVVVGRVVVFREQTDERDDRGVARVGDVARLTVGDRDRGSRGGIFVELDVRRAAPPAETASGVSAGSDIAELGSIGSVELVGGRSQHSVADLGLGQRRGLGNEVSPGRAGVFIRGPGGDRLGRGLAGADGVVCVVADDSTINRKTSGGADVVGRRIFAGHFDRTANSDSRRAVVVSRNAEDRIATTR